MYKLTLKDQVFTIPKESIRLLAMQKSFDLKDTHVKLDTTEDAIKYLQTFGITIKESEE